MSGGKREDRFQSWVSDCPDPPKSGRKSTPQILWHTCRPSLMSRGGTAGAQRRPVSRRWHEVGGGQGSVVGSWKDPSPLLVSVLSLVLRLSLCTSRRAVAGGVPAGLLECPRPSHWQLDAIPAFLFVVTAVTLLSTV